MAAYLAGNVSPHFKAYPKIEFILRLSSKASNIFPERFELIEKHTSSLQQFYAESLNLVKDNNLLLMELAHDLDIPIYQQK